MLSKKGFFGGKTLGALPFCEDCVYGKHKCVSFDSLFIILKVFLITFTRIFRAL